MWVVIVGSLLSFSLRAANAAADFNSNDSSWAPGPGGSLIQPLSSISGTVSPGREAVGTPIADVLWPVVAKQAPDSVENQREQAIYSDKRLPLAAPPPSFAEIGHWNPGGLRVPVKSAAVEDGPLVLPASDLSPESGAKLLSAGLAEAANLTNVKSTQAPQQQSPSIIPEVPSLLDGSSLLDVIAALNKALSPAASNSSRRQLQDAVSALNALVAAGSPNMTAQALNKVTTASDSLSSLFSSLGGLKQLSTTGGNSGDSSPAAGSSSDMLSKVFGMISQFSNAGSSMLVPQTTTTPSPVQKVQSGLTAIMAGISQLGQVLQSLNLQIAGAGAAGGLQRRLRALPTV